MFWRLGGQFVVVGGWLVQAQGTPQNSIIRFHIIRVLRINSVLYQMGHLRSPYDPSLVFLYENTVCILISSFPLHGDCCKLKYISFLALRGCVGSV